MRKREPATLLAALEDRGRHLVTGQEREQTVVGEREGEVTKGREKVLAALWGLRPFSRQYL